MFKNVQNDIITEKMLPIEKKWTNMETKKDEIRED